MTNLTIPGLLLLLWSCLVGCQEGYEYGPPPVETQLRPRPQPVTAQESKPQPSAGGGGGGGGHSHGDAGDPLAWLRESVPGEPGVDYPILSSPPTGFSCGGRPAGLYADVSGGCQAWHQCLGDNMWSFLCPNGTIFNQQIFTCVWWFDFDCQEAEGLYGLNEELYQSTGGDDSAGGSSATTGTAGVTAARPTPSGGRPGPSGGKPGSSGGRPRPTGGVAGPSGGKPGTSVGRPGTSGGRPRPSGGRPGSSGGRPGSSGGRPGSSGGRPGPRPGGSHSPSGGRPDDQNKGLVLVLPVLGEEEDDVLAGYQPDTLYGAPGGRSGRRKIEFGGLFDY